MKLNFWLSRFVNEVRNQKGEHYPPRAIQQILAGLQREVLKHTPDFPKFLDRHNTVYSELHRCCDLVYRQLHSSGVGTVIENTETFNSEEEDKMWSTGVFSIDHPKSLQRAIFFYVGKHFCIRGGEEQRKLKPSQFICCSNPEKYI